MCARATPEEAERSIAEWAAQIQPVAKGIRDVFPRSSKFGLAGAVVATVGAVAEISARGREVTDLLVAIVIMAAIGAMSYASRFRDLWAWTVIARYQLADRRDVVSEHLSVARVRFARETGDQFANLAAAIDLPSPTVAGQVRRCADSAAVVAMTLVLVWVSLVISADTASGALARWIPPRFGPLALVPWAACLAAGIAFTGRFVIAVSDDLAAYAHRQIAVAAELGALADELADVNQDDWFLTPTAE